MTRPRASPAPAATAVRGGGSVGSSRWFVTIDAPLRHLGTLRPRPKLFRVRHGRQEMQQRLVEAFRVLEEGEMAGLRQDQEARTGNVRGDELGVLALDSLVTVAIDDPGRRGDGSQIALAE